MSEPTKWVCEYCTYENFTAALKCTMCRGFKPLLNEDIYRLRDESPTSRDDVLRRPSSGGISPGCGPSPREPHKPRESWHCQVCSHVNWARAKECAECHAPRTYTPADLAEQLRPLRIDCNTDTTTSSSSVKWTCPTCTYDNWPRSIRCIMCGTMPRVSPMEGAGSIIIEDNVPCVKRSSLRRDDPVNLSPPNNSARYRQRSPLDRSWLNACLGVVQGDHSPVETFLSNGGDPTRQLTASEVAYLNRPSAFDTGHTLVHLAIRFHREDLLATLLSRIEGSGSGVKRVPSYVAPDLAADIRRHAASTLRQRKGTMPCPYLNEMPTFTLPAEIEELPASIQEQLFEELLDKDAQRQLEDDPPVINWSLEVTVHLGSRLHALWNRSAGDCLLDSLMQTTWGVFDRDNLLRKALADTLNNGGHLFYPRWREYESCQARLLQFSLEETQWQQDWAGLMSLATQPGASLEQLHVFALAHILRRPIIVYGVKYVKSFRGEDLGYARFEGVYLPLLWEPGFCTKSPVALGYTRGHFSALVPIEPYSSPETAANDLNQDSLQVTFLPLMDHDKKILPVHFTTQSEMGREESLLRQWLDVGVTDGGLLVAQQRLNKRPLLVAQMLEEWLNHYRRLAQMSHAPFSRPIPVQDYSSDGDTDDE
ncbi:ubiquitin thioesterase trabid-like [Macrosteles quadrilineatus]|uniref:ubiquitin thioesterase trabid-like n=1 Tax=Macrosteles quadrilineatus TaxID=74068 RepID=UPI0023E0F0EF|nr:ubiquitin thioesterase trabid-like [Macrosteles quadrilineatus]